MGSFPDFPTASSEVKSSHERPQELNYPREQFTEVR